MEPLIPLARAIASEADRLQLPCAVVRIDAERRAVIVEGFLEDAPRDLLRSTLVKARLAVEVAGQGRLVVYPS
jgi:hypothetical protein